MKPSGILMRPASLTEENNEQVMRGTKYWAEGDFYEKYCEHIAASQLIAESAKIFITKNWQQISDWSGLEIHIEDRIGETRYYKFRESDGMVYTKHWEKIIKRRKENENPVHSVTEVVLDPTDGDFSITINGKEHWWISDSSVIELADFVEKELKKTIHEG